MKNLILTLCVLVAVVFSVAVDAAPTQLLVVTLAANTTNTVTGVPAWPYTQVLQNASIYHGVLTNNIGTANTSAFGINVYANAPNTTATNGRVFLGTWYPTTTNAATETVQGVNFSVTNYISFDIFTTNIVILNGTYGQ